MSEHKHIDYLRRFIVYLKYTYIKKYQKISILFI